MLPNAPSWLREPSHLGASLPNRPPRLWASLGLFSFGTSCLPCSTSQNPALLQRPSAWPICLFLDAFSGHLPPPHKFLWKFLSWTVLSLLKTYRDHRSEHPCQSLEKGSALGSGEEEWYLPAPSPPALCLAPVNASRCSWSGWGRGFKFSSTSGEWLWRRWDG